MLKLRAFFIHIHNCNNLLIYLIAISDKRITNKNTLVKK